jgi:hypothetical protein
MSNWDELDGYGVAHNVPALTKLPLGRAMNYVWYMLVRHADSAERAKLRAKLWLPPKGTEIPAESPWSAENEMGALRSLKAGLGGKTASE